MIDLTYNLAFKYHREMWQWLHDTGYQVKAWWPGWLKYKIDPSEIENKCFLCAKAGERDEEYPCIYCPAVWGGAADVCEDTDNQMGYYYMWSKGGGVFGMRHFAARIRDVEPTPRLKRYIDKVNGGTR